MGEILDNVWELTQAREAWSLVKDSQNIQSKLLELMEEQEKEIALADLEQARLSRMEKLSRISDYWSKKRMEAKLEAVRGGISILNLTTDWLEWMEVETDDHKEMDKMMDMTGAMVDMTGISITEEEHRLYELMTTLAPAMGAVEARNKISAQKCSDM